MIQTNSAEDRIISEKDKWRESAKFLQENIIDRIRLTQSRLHELVGPEWMEQWTGWKSRTREQYINSYIKAELEKLASQNVCTQTDYLCR